MSPKIGGAAHVFPTEAPKERFTFRPDKFSYEVQAYVTAPEDGAVLSVSYGAGALMAMNNCGQLVKIPSDKRTIQALIETGSVKQTRKMKDQYIPLVATLRGRFLDIKFGTFPRYQPIQGEQYTCKYILDGAEESHTMQMAGDIVTVTSTIGEELDVKEYQLKRIKQRIIKAGQEVSELDDLRFMKKGPLLFYREMGYELPWEER